jgi:Cytochrome c
MPQTATQIVGDAVQKILRKQLSIAIIIVATNACVWAQDLEKGRIEFMSKCAGCHGSDGKGSGPLSSKLTIKPADLTALAKRNNGVFSPDAVAERVDGRSEIEPHRDSEMPIWGCRQGPPPGPQKKAYEPKPIDSLLNMPCDPEEVIRNRILDVVEYLAQIQEK